MTTLYVARMGDTNYYKIGITGDVERRMSEFQTPLAVEPILTLEGSSGDERLLHKLLENKRKNGEWFELDSQQIEGLDEAQNLSQLKQALDPRPVVDPSELGYYAKALAAVQKCSLHGLRPILRNIYYFLNQDCLQYDSRWPKLDYRRENRRTVRYDLMALVNREEGVLRRKGNKYFPLKVLSDPCEQIPDLCYIASTTDLTKHRRAWVRGSEGLSGFKASLNSRTGEKNIRVFKTQTQCEEFVNSLGLSKAGVVGAGGLYIYLCRFEVGGWSSAVNSDGSSFYLKKGSRIRPLVSRKSDGWPSYKRGYPIGIPRYWDLLFDDSL